MEPVRRASLVLRTDTKLRTKLTKVQTAALDDVYRKFRAGDFGLPSTRGLENLPKIVKPQVQCNYVGIPSRHSTIVDDFYEFCLANSKALPLIEVHDAPTGFLSAPTWNASTDLCNFRWRRDGTTKSSKDDFSLRKELAESWETEDFVSFLTGCSFTFEAELSKFDLSLPTGDANVSMYVTNLPTVPVGVFRDVPLVVSMRWIRVDKIDRVNAICERRLEAHGEPLYVGFDFLDVLGIESLDRPDFGDVPKPPPRPRSKYGELEYVPAFWCCGVTGSLALRSLEATHKVSYLTHEPGQMVVTALH